MNERVMKSMKVNAILLETDGGTKEDEQEDDGV